MFHPRNSSIPGLAALVFFCASIFALFLLILITGKYLLFGDSVRPLLWYWVAWFTLFIMSGLGLSFIEYVEKGEKDNGTTPNADDE